MIDLHCHLLPGIDDGPADMAGAVALVREMAAAGVQTVAATPHVRPDHPGVVPSELAGRVRALTAEVRGIRVVVGGEVRDVRVVVGGEVDLFWAVHAGDDELRAVSFAGRGTDLLVETPYGTLPPVFEDLLFQLTARGYRILLAHPERCAAFRADPARLAALVERGALLQVTAGALTGHGLRAGLRRFAAALIRERLAHVIASDAHRAGSGRALVPDGVAAAAGLAGGYAEWMATDAPAAILAGDPLPPPPAAGARRRRPLARRRFG